MSWRTVMSFLWRRDFLISHDGIRKLIDDHIPYRNLEDAKVPVHIVTTDIISGDSIVLSEGSTSQAIVASTSIPGAFRPIRYKDYIWPMARSPATRRSRSRFRRGQSA
jgi:NTE family protein